MSGSSTFNRRNSRWKGGLWFCGVLMVCAVSLSAAEPVSKTDQPAKADSISGREIFLREWLPNDPRSHGGDGLGPVFNDSSCVACHNQGGAGGGGTASKNVNIISATFNSPINPRVQPRVTPGQSILRTILGLPAQPGLTPRPPTKEDLEKQRQQLVEEISQVHPGFRTATSVVIHHDGLNPKYDSWKDGLLAASDQQMRFGNPGTAFAVQPPMAAKVAFIEEVNVQHNHDVVEAIESVREATVQEAAGVEIGDSGHSPAEPPRAGRSGRMSSTELQLARMQLQRAKQQAQSRQFSSSTQRGHFAISTSRRNATALFGAGVIDAVSDKVLEEAAARKFKDYPEISGRVARLADGRIGRFGWKAQKATLRDFTVTACAVELGLHVPEHPQSGDPHNPKYAPTGYDLTRAECDALVNYLSELPAPAPRTPAHPQEKEFLDQGQTLFANVGCAACHTADLGEAKNLYSDLLLHDLGPELGDTGSYGVFLPDSPGGDGGSPVPPITQLTQPQQQQRGGLLNMVNSTTDAQPKAIIGAERLEWRTPPLWGVRDSAPYLHDGRADTLEQAIALHGGEASKSALKFFALKPEEQRQLVFFLKSLAAPDELANR